MNAKLMDSVLQDSVDLLYQAVAAPECWEHLLSTVRQYTASHSGSIQLDRLDNSAVISGYFQGFDPALVDSYLNHYYAHDIWMQAGLARPDRFERIFCSDELVDLKTGRQSLFYNEWGREAEMEYSCGLGIQAAPGVILKLTLQRNRRAGSFLEPSVDQFLTRLRPHLAAAWRASQRVIPTQSPEQLISLMPSPALVLDKSATVVAVNAQFEQQCRDNGPVSVRHQKARFPATVHETIFDNIRRSCNLTDNPDLTPSEQFFCFCPRQHPWMIRLQPLVLESDYRLRLGGRRRLVLVTLESMQRQLDTTLLRSWFDLTVTETLIVADLFAGLSVRDICHSSRRSEHTVRSTLKDIFRKCNVHRQAELITAVATSPAWR